MDGARLAFLPEKGDLRLTRGVLKKVQGMDLRVSSLPLYWGSSGPAVLRLLALKPSDPCAGLSLYRSKLRFLPGA